MYVIKMDADKNLVTTVHSTILRGENNADILAFLLPKMCGSVGIAACTVLLRYILPNGIGRSEELERYPVPYNDDYHKYRLGIASRFTETAGDIELWLTVIGFDDEVVLKTRTTVITISDSKDISNYLPGGSIDQLDRLALQVKQLERNKADSLSYDTDEYRLQLTANGELIGDSVELVVGG